MDKSVAEPNLDTGGLIIWHLGQGFEVAVRIVEQGKVVGSRPVDRGQVDR